MLVMLSLLPLLGRQPDGVLQTIGLANLTVEGLGRKVSPLSFGQALAALFGRNFTKPNLVATVASDYLAGKLSG